MRVLIVWCIVGAFVGALIGARKNQTLSGLIWGGLLGFVGWIIVLVLPSRLPKCPSCGGDLPANKVSICKHCRSEVPASLWRGSEPVPPRLRRK
jgi:uncharacterized membrane protein